jgi:hypothetical protein
LAVLGVGTLLTIGRWAAAFRKPRKACEPWRRYAEDTFLGLNWRWQIDDAGEPWNFRSYCPQCDLEITKYERGIGQWDPLSCPNCRYEFEALGENRDVYNKVKRLVEKNIRTKDWTKENDPGRKQ